MSLRNTAQVLRLGPCELRLTAFKCIKGHSLYKGHIIKKAVLKLNIIKTHLSLGFIAFMIRKARILYNDLNVYKAGNRELF